MSTTMKLTDTQSQILKHAAKSADGKLVWFPATVKGGLRKRVIDGLFNRALISPSGEDWIIAAEGYAAVGRARPTPATKGADGALEAAVAEREASWVQDKPDAAKPPPKTRENSKQAQVITMLKRPTGATIEQICNLTGWQKHTVRGAFAGSFKKKLGLTIESSKETGGERVYRIAA